MSSASNRGPNFRKGPSRRTDYSENHEEGGQERWLLTYADMITLLLVLFIVLFAIANIDQAKFREFKQSVAHVFKQTPTVTTTTLASARSKSAPVNKLEQIEKELRAALKAKGLLADVEFSINASGLVEGLVADSAFFVTNSAVLSPLGVQIVDASADVLHRYRNAIEIAGFTDNRPITGGLYQNNWELSAARATTVVLRMTEVDGVNSGQITIIGYGQYHPVVPNDSASNRAKNRRVNIVVSPSATFRQ